MLKFASHFVGGLLIANAFEWAAHKYILHGTPRKGQPRYSPSPASMNSHWTHHRMVRKTQFADGPLYTSDAADDIQCVYFAGFLIIYK